MLYVSAAVEGTLEILLKLLSKSGFVLVPLQFYHKLKQTNIDIAKIRWFENLENIFDQHLRNKAPPRCIMCSPTEFKTWL